MEGTESENKAKPLVEPRLVQFLKDRPRLVDRGLRKEFLEQLEQNIRVRRQPDSMAERTVQEMFRNLEEAGGGVVRDRTKNALEKANNGPLERL